MLYGLEAGKPMVIEELRWRIPANPSENWNSKFGKALIKERDLSGIRDTLKLVKTSALSSDALLGSYLIHENLPEANNVSSNLSEPDSCSWSAIMSATARLGLNEQALKIYHQMYNFSVEPDAYVFVAVLKACSRIGSLDEGKQIHAHVIERGIDSDLFVGNTLIDMYVKCKRLDDAHLVLAKLPKTDVVTWSALIAGHAQQGQAKEALLLFQQMKQEGVSPNGVLFLSILKSCSSLEQGKKIHFHIIESGLENDLPIANTLINMYAKCGNLEDAQKVFNKLPQRDVITWSALIAGFSQNGHGQEALQCFQEMQQEGIEPDNVTFVSIVKACSSIGALEQGMLFHSLIIGGGFALDLFVGSTLINMYVKCGSLRDAHMVFDKLPKRDVVIWGGLIAGYSQHGQADEALQLFQKMQLEGTGPSPSVLICLLKACRVLEQGKELHSCVLAFGFESNLFVGNTLVDMYAKCGSLKDARVVFDGMQKRDVVTWSALLVAYTQHGLAKEALQLFTQMEQEGVKPNQVTFNCILKACSSIATLDQGRQIHLQLIENGFELVSSVGNTLTEMYSKCGSLKDAHTVFQRLPRQDVVSWSILIAAYAQLGNGKVALELFQHMQQVGMEPDQTIFVCILQACSSTTSPEQGKWIHKLIIDGGMESDLFVGNAVIGMYFKVGNLENAQSVFDRLTEKDVVTWNALITGYAHNELGQEALQIYQQMQQEGMEPNQVTLVCILKACSGIAALEHGRQIHSQTIEKGFVLDSFIGSALIGMYMKCGSLEDACAVFDSLSKQDVATWNALIAGYAQRYNYPLVLQCFVDMQQACCRPNDVTFLCLLSACSHSGLVDDGCLYLKSMREDPTIVARLEHFNSMIGLLGHAGCLNEAEDLLESLQFQSNVVGWTSLLDSCRKHGNVKIGRRCFDQVVTMEGHTAGDYTLMSKIYANAGMWEDAETVDEFRKMCKYVEKASKCFYFGS